MEGIKLPKASNVQIHDISRILNPRAKLSELDKLEHFLKLETALLSKLYRKTKEKLELKAAKKQQ